MSAADDGYQLGMKPQRNAPRPATGKICPRCCGSVATTTRTYCEECGTRLQPATEEK